jgi:hypothetical protein
MRLRDAHARDIPGEQQLWDYDVREDGQWVYYGHANIELAEGDYGWVILYATYNADGTLASAKCRLGTWTGRVALFS